MSIYKTGTVSVTNGSATVTGTGTNWLGKIAPGQVFALIGEVSYTIASVASDTSLTLTAPYGGTTKSGQTYSVTRDFTTGGLPLLAPGTVSASGVLNPVVQALEDANNSAQAGINSALKKSANLSDVDSVTDSRNNLELDSAALRPVGAETDTDIPDKGLLRTEYGLRKALSVQPTLSSDFTRNEHKVYEQYGLEPKTITQQWDVTRNGTATYVDATGKIRTAGIDEPRITFDPETGENLGLLVEESRTNLLLWSEDFTQSVWSIIKLTSTESGIPSPIQGTNFTRFNEIDGETGALDIIQNVNTVVGLDYVYSVFIKDESGGRHSTFALRSISNNYISTKELNEGIDYGNGVFRVDFIFTAEAETSDLRLRTSVDLGDSQFSFLVTGAQLEQASTPSSYIPTTDMQVTRPADNVVRTLGDEFNSNQFTLTFKGEMLNNDNQVTWFSIGDGATTNRINFGTSLIIYAINGSAVATLASSLGLGEHIFAFSYDNGIFLYYVDGVQVQNQNIGSGFNANNIRIAQRQATTTERGDVSVEHIHIISRALSATELQELTTL